MATKATRLYSGALPMLGPSNDNIVGEDDDLRCRSYDFYEDLYHNRPEAYRIVIGNEESGKPLYLPGARRIIEATNRFLGVGFDYVVDPNRGSQEDRAIMDRYFSNLFKRERMYSKHNNQRRYGLIRGGAIWHIRGDDTKPEGRRISIDEVHPSQYFPIEDPMQPGRLIGVHLVDVVKNPRDPSKQVARRQTYRRTLDGNGSPTGQITTELGLFELGKWDDRVLKPEDIKLVQMLRPPTALHPSITSLPVYHVPNSEISGSSDLFGLSQLNGLEVIQMARSQAVSDSDLSLAITGLGVYWTTAGAPVDESGNPTSWRIAPGFVAELKENQQFGRVDGITSVQPFIDHMEYLRQEGDSAYGVPDVASGRVDVQVAESGVSLMLQFAPLLAMNQEKEGVMVDTYDWMIYDIVNMWMPAYEGLELDASVASKFDDAMPVNRDAEIQEVINLISCTPPLITIQQAIDKLSKLGYDYSQGDDTKLLEQLRLTNKYMAGDEFANRYEQELEDGSDETNVGGDAITALSSAAAQQAAAFSGVGF